MKNYPKEIEETYKHNLNSKDPNDIINSLEHINKEFNSRTDLIEKEINREVLRIYTKYEHRP